MAHWFLYLTSNYGILVPIRQFYMWIDEKDIDLKTNTTVAAMEADISCATIAATVKKVKATISRQRHYFLLSPILLPKLQNQNT